MAVIHIPEEEARRDFGAVLSRFDDGDDVVIDRAVGSITLIGASPRKPLTFAEAIARLPQHSAGVIDEGFAADARSFRDNHQEVLNSKWD